MNVGSFGKNLNLGKSLVGNSSAANLGKQSSGSSVAASISNNKVLSISLMEITSNEGVSFEGIIDEKLTPDLALRYALQNILPMIAEEMNFVKQSFLGISDSISISEMEEKMLLRIE